MFDDINDFVPKDYPSWLFTCNKIGGPVVTCLSCYMPISASSDLITAHLIDFLSEHFKTWSQRFADGQDKMPFKENVDCKDR